MVTQLRRVGARRVVWVVVLGGGTFAGLRMWNRRSTAVPIGPPEWPPIEAPTTNPSIPSDTPAPFVATEPAAEPRVADAPTIVASSDIEPSVAAPPAADQPVVDDRPVVWVAAVAGSCPASHPIKANNNSGIYHVPGGRFYDRTGAERCYALADHAEADGYRRSKS